MGSKIILLLGLAMALVLLTSSEVAARNLAETSTNMRKGQLLGLYINLAFITIIGLICLN